MILEQFHNANTWRPGVAGERYQVVRDEERWIVLDTKEFRPFLATYHQDCPDAEKMAKSLASWLNSGTEA